MVKVQINKKDGTPTQYFWLQRPSADRKSTTVYKQTTDGVKRMKGVRFNAETNRMRKV